MYKWWKHRYQQEVYHSRSKRWLLQEGYDDKYHWPAVHEK